MDFVKGVAAWVVAFLVADGVFYSLQALHN